MKVRNVTREKEKKYNYVYKLTLKNDKRYYYVGKRSTDKEDDSSYLGSGKALKEFKEKYGNDCFEKEILSYWGNAEEALEEEARIVTKDLVKDEFCLNRIVGGGCFDATGCLRGKASPEEIQKNSESHKGLKQSEETKKKRSETIRKKWLDENYRKAQHDGRKGKYDKHLQELSKNRLNRVCVIKDGKWKYIEKDDVEKYLSEGWLKRGVENKPTYEEIIAYRKEGLSYSKIGKIYGVGESAVRNWKKKYENLK